MPLSITIVESFRCWFGVADGWFDDPIGLSAKAYILVPPIAFDKFLLARPHLNPQIRLLSDPRAYASSPHWLLLSVTKPHSHAPLRHINVPAQHAYMSSPDWSPQSRCCLYPGVIPFMTLGLLTNFDAFVVFIDPLSYSLLSDGPITFLILSLGPKRQQDYASARFLTKRIIIDGLVSGHTFL